MQKKASNLMVVEQYKQKGYQGLLPLLKEHSDTMVRANDYLKDHAARLGLHAKSKFHSGDYPEVAAFLSAPYTPDKTLKLHHHLFKDTVEIPAEDIVIVAGGSQLVMPLLIAPAGQEKLTRYFDSLKHKKPDSDIYFERIGELHATTAEKPKLLPPGRPANRSASLVQGNRYEQPLALLLLNGIHNEHERDKTVALIGKLLDGAHKSDKREFIFHRIVSLNVDDFKQKDGTLLVSGQSAENLELYFRNKNLSLSHL